MGAQIEYAALDAWASRQVLVAMRANYGVARLDCERLLGANTMPSTVLGLRLPQKDTAKLADAPPAERASTEQSNSSAEQTPSLEAHQTLAALCVERGYVLRFDGFEAAAGGYRCIFRVEWRQQGRMVAEAFRSKRPHASIRAAQNDAASEALCRLQPDLTSE